LEGAGLNGGTGERRRATWGGERFGAGSGEVALGPGKTNRGGVNHEGHARFDNGGRGVCRAHVAVRPGREVALEVVMKEGGDQSDERVQTENQETSPDAACLCGCGHGLSIDTT